MSGSESDVSDVPPTKKQGTKRKTEKGDPKKRRVRRKKQKGEPKKPLSGYMFYVQANRATVASDKSLSFGEVGKKLGAMWAQLTEDEKKPFNEKNERDKVRYNQEKAEWDAKGHGGDDDGGKKKKKKEKKEKPKKKASSEDESGSGSGSGSDSDN